MVELPTSALNFRPVSGVRLRSGRGLFRSGDLSELSRNDARLLVGRCGLRTYIDLRAEKEQEASRLTQLSRCGTRCLSVPLRGTDASFRAIRDPLARDYADLYCRMLRQDGEAIARCLTKLSAPPPGSIAFGCRAGKDRTGIIAALVLGLLGAKPTVIVLDYVRSAVALRSSIDRFRADWERKGLTRSEYARRLACRRRTMVEFCRHVDLHYGGWTSCATALGMSSSAIMRLRRAFIYEPQPSSVR